MFLSFSVAVGDTFWKGFWVGMCGRIRDIEGNTSGERFLFVCISLGVFSHIFSGGEFGCRFLLERSLYPVFQVSSTLPDTNITPDNRPLEKEIPNLENMFFWGELFLSGRVVLVSLRR